SVQILSVNVVSGTNLTATVVFSDVPGARNLTVTTPSGSNTLPFTILSSPLSGAGLSNVFHLAGSTGGPGATDGAATATKFRQPGGVWSDGVNLFVADNLNNTIRKVSLATGATTTIAGTALASGNTDGIGSAARFFHPWGVWGDGTNLWVADGDNSLIRKIVLSTGAVTTVAGSSPGFADGVGTAAQFGSLRYIWGDGTDLFIADLGNNVIRRMNLTTNAVSTLAGTPGIPGSADGVGSAASFNSPGGIWGDGSGNLFITDFGNNTIRQ